MYLVSYALGLDMIWQLCNGFQFFSLEEVVIAKRLKLVKAYLMALTL